VPFGDVGTYGATGHPPVSGGTALSIGGLPGSGTIQLDEMQGMDALGMFAWLVPGLLLRLPGLLILLVILAQLGFASAFIPVTRRVLGSRRPRAGALPEPHTG
jgi:hypothetical protein